MYSSSLTEEDLFLQCVSAGYAAIWGRKGLDSAYVSLWRTETASAEQAASPSLCMCRKKSISGNRPNKLRVS